MSSYNYLSSGGFIFNKTETKISQNMVAYDRKVMGLYFFMVMNIDISMETCLLLGKEHELQLCDVNGA